MKLKKKFKWILTAFLAGVLLFSLAACRPSPALEEIIYTGDATVVDVKHQKLERDKRHEDSQKNEDFKDENEGDQGGDVDTDNVNKDNGGSAAKEARDKGSNGGGEGEGATLRYSEEGDDNGKVKGEQPTKEQPTKEEPTTKSPEEPTTREKDVEDGDKDLKDYEEDPEEQDPEQPGPDPEDDPLQEDEPETGGNVKLPEEGEDPEEGDDPFGDEEGEPTPEKEPKERKLINYGGIEQEVPVNADTVTACGYAAQLVEMLGGADRLIGADADFTTNWFTQSIIEDIGSVQTWWAGDGSDVLDDASFQNLLNASPDAVFEISGDYSFSDSQLSSLAEADIGYVVIPAPTSTANIINGAKIVATVLTDHSDGRDAMNIAEQYDSWVDGVQSDVAAGDSLVYSTYISGWRDDISYMFYNGRWDLLPIESGGPTGGGTGVATGYSAKADVILPELLDWCGVTNEAAATGSSVDTPEVIIAPMFKSLDAQYDFIGPYSVYPNRLPSEVEWGLFHGGSVNTLLGDLNFRYVIAADYHTQQELLNSWYWRYQGVFTTNKAIYYSGYVAEADEFAYFPNSIIGDYTVLINPAGFENWAVGSVDAPLEAYWLKCYVREEISEDQLYENIRRFYETFFGISLSNGEIQGILDGQD